MRALLVLVTVADAALAILLIAVSGFVLEGVNGGGPEMPGAALFIAMIIVTLVAPFVAWGIRARAGDGAAVLTGALPLALAVLALLAEPLFV